MAKGPKSSRYRVFEISRVDCIAIEVLITVSAKTLIREYVVIQFNPCNSNHCNSKNPLILRTDSLVPCDFIRLTKTPVIRKPVNSNKFFGPLVVRVIRVQLYTEVRAFKVDGNNSSHVLL